MIPWRREWQPNPVFLSGEFHGQSSLASYGAWGHKKSDMTEQLTYIHTVVKNLPANEGDLRDLMACSIKNPPTMQETCRNVQDVIRAIYKINGLSRIQYT